MDKLMSILTHLMQGEEAVMTAVPLTSVGKAGNVMGIILTAEATALGFLQALAARKQASAAVTPAEPVNINAIPTA